MRVPVKIASASRVGKLVSRILFPDTCLACHAPVAQQGVVCPTCWSNVHFIDKPYCDVTGLPFQHSFGDMIVSAEAIANPPKYNRARAAVVHAGVARQLVQRLKYGDRTDLAPWLAAWMVRAGRELIDDSDIVIPVPLHPRRYWTRRFNQSAELARAIARQSHLPFEPDALSRRKPTRQQVGLKAREREENVRGAFVVPETARIRVQGKRVLLVDDVFTTGATVTAATRALIKAKAAQVDVLTFSRVVPGFIL